MLKGCVGNTKLHKEGWPASWGKSLVSSGHYPSSRLDSCASERGEIRRHTVVSPESRSLRASKDPLCGQSGQD